MIVIVGSMYLCGAYSRVPYCYAHEDPRYQYNNNLPHPENLKFSAAAQVANILKEPFIYGRPVIADTMVISEINQLLAKYPDAFVIAETFQPPGTSGVVKRLTNHPSLVVSKTHAIGIPALNVIAANTEAVNDPQFVDDEGHRLIAKSMLQYIITTHKEFFNL